MYDGLAAHFGAEPDRFRDVWLRGRRERELGPMEPHLRSLADELFAVACRVVGRAGGSFRKRGE